MTVRSPKFHKRSIIQDRQMVQVLLIALATPRPRLVTLDFQRRDSLRSCQIVPRQPQAGRKRPGHQTSLGGTFSVSSFRSSCLLPRPQQIQSCFVKFWRCLAQSGQLSSNFPQTLVPRSQQLFQMAPSGTILSGCLGLCLASPLLDQCVQQKEFLRDGRR